MKVASACSPLSRANSPILHGGTWRTKSAKGTAITHRLRRGCSAFVGGLRFDVARALVLSARGLLDAPAMRRFWVGLFLVLHGLAHAAFGMAAQDLPGIPGHALSGPPRVWLATALFLGAMPGFMAAGFGRWGVIGLRHHWQSFAYGAIAASAALLVIFPRGLLATALGLAFDAIALLLTMATVDLTLRGLSARGRVAS